MAESFAEQVSRVRQMATGDNHTWDLSVHECAALTGLLNSHDALLVALKGLRGAVVDDSTAAIVHALIVAERAIAAAEAREEVTHG